MNEAIPKLRPGLYVLAAAPAGLPQDDYGERATQWFVVSDLGLTAYSGADGIHAFVNSLATTAPVGGVELRLVARNNEILATEIDGSEWRCHLRAWPGAGRGRP